MHTSTRLTIKHAGLYFHEAELKLSEKYNNIDKGCTMDDNNHFTLSYIAPYRWDRMLAFLAMRAIPGVETVCNGAYWRTVRAYTPSESQCCGWICARNNAQENCIEVWYSSQLKGTERFLQKRLEHLFDTTRNPADIGSKLASLNAYHSDSFVSGTRIPGCYDGFEMACRAVLGQQISVKSASTLAGRMAAQFGTPLNVTIPREILVEDAPEAQAPPELTCLFPTPQDVLQLAKRAPIENAFGSLGIIGTRARTMLALAELIVQNPTAIAPCSNMEATPEEKIAALVQLSGIGDWTAHYIAMRAMGYADAFPATDLGIIKFLGTKKKKELIAAAEQWRPWRSYAVLNMWSAEQAQAWQVAAEKKTPSKGRSSNATKQKASAKKKQPTKQGDKQVGGQPTQRSEQTVATAWYDTPFMGRVMLAVSDTHLVGLWMEGQKYFGASMPAGTVVENPQHPLIQQAYRWLDKYFAGKKPAISDLPLKPQGSEFRHVIWKLLCDIPYGQTSTYGELATKAAKILGKDHMASLAVGGAVGHNPISIIVPCHRVVGANGSLTGYAGGLDKKIALLAHEGIDTEQLFRPTKGTAL